MLTCLAVLYPTLWVIKMAVTPSQAFTMSPNPWPTSVSIENFWVLISGDDPSTDVFDGDWQFLRQFWNSAFIAFLTTIVGMTFSTTAAYGMSRFRFPGKDAGMSFFLLTQMFPGVVMAIPLYILMDTLGLLNSAFGLALAYSSTAGPFCTWNLKGYFDTILKI